MSDTPSTIWPWLGLAGLGIFHGINPAMGWLFAVALSLHRRNRGILFLSLIPIALGHAAAVAVVVAAALALGVILDHGVLNWIAAAMLIGWAVWHAARGHRQRVHVGMQTGLAGLGLWSFLMASAHGAGLMLIPLVSPICLAAAPAQDLTADSSFPVATAALGLHTAAMLGTIAAVSTLVRGWIGLGFLRRGWINLDRIWIAALVGSGILLLFA